jgi:NAD(P)-dependent dehydrogenase (short-subunit alcohol dehydrogenase family)
MRLKDRVAIVTGAGGGIGAATAKRFAAEGASVVVADVMDEQAAAVVAEIEGAGGVAIAAHCNVADKSEVDALVAAAVDAFGTVHILVNNAGITRDGFAAKLTEEKWDAVIDVNLKGAFLCAQAVMPIMNEQGWGRIISTSSIGADGNMGQANYAASKAGIVGLTRTLSLEGARNNVLVNCISPGATETQMFAGVPEKVVKFMLSRIPLGRLANPDEIASVHTFLASDDSSYITGQNIEVDGGALIGI